MAVITLGSLTAKIMKRLMWSCRRLFRTLHVDYFYEVIYAFPPQKYSLKVTKFLILDIFLTFGVFSTDFYKLQISVIFAFPHPTLQIPTWFPSLLVTRGRRLERRCYCKDLPVAVRNKYLVAITYTIKPYNLLWGWAASPLTPLQHGEVFYIMKINYTNLC